MPFLVRKTLFAAGLEALPLSTLMGMVYFMASVFLKNKCLVLGENSL